MRYYGRSVIPALMMLFAVTACGKSKAKTDRKDLPKAAQANATSKGSGTGTGGPAGGAVRDAGATSKQNGAVALTGCGGAAAVGLSIVGGEDVCADALVGKSTVILYDGNGAELCTATRIGPNQLITAAHCLEGGVVNMQIGYLGAPKAQVAADSGSSSADDSAAEDSGDDESHSCCSNDGKTSPTTDKSAAKKYGYYGNGYYRRQYLGYKLTLRARAAPKSKNTIPQDLFQDDSDASCDDDCADSSTANSTGTAAAPFVVNPASVPGVDPSLKIVATVFHPRFDTMINGKANNYQDIGMVIFSGSMPVAITPIAAFGDFPTTTAALAKAADKTLIKAGFGSRGEADASDNDNLQSVVLSVAALDQANGELAYQVGTKKGTCYGDSGGPGYLKAGSALKLIGITSRGPDLTDAQGNVTELGCDEGNGIDTDARYYRGWISCVAQRVNKQFPNDGLAAPTLTVEAQDTSASSCDQTVIKTPAQLAADSKSACQATAGMTFDDLSGGCSATTAAACQAVDGTWDAADQSCAIAD